MSIAPREQQSLGIFTAAKLGVVVTFVTLMALGFIIQHTTNRDLSEQLSKRERELAAFRNEINVKRAQVAALKSPKYLRRKIEEFQLGLQEIAHNQIIRLYDQPSVPALPAGQTRPFANAEEL